MSRILFGLSLWLLAQTALAQQASLTGSLPRDLGEGRFRLTFTVQGLSDEYINRGASDGDGNVLLKNRFDIKLTTIGANEILPIDQTEAASATRLSKFYMQEGQPYVQDPPDIQNTVNTHSQRYYIDIIEAVPGELANKVGTGGTVSVALYFYLGRAQNSEAVVSMDNPVTVIKQEIYLIAEAPEFEGDAPIAGSHKSLIVNWKVKTAVATKGDANTGNREPSSVVVYVFHPDVESQELPARVFSGNAATPDTDGACTYSRPAPDQGGACISCPDNAYLNRAAIKDKLGGKVTIVSGRNADGQIKVDGLDNDVASAYTVAMQYLPDGLGASTCLPGKPSANFTLTEINGEGDAEVVDFRCFIATAAYGSPMAEDLKYFRKFRSQVLLKSTVGRAFVRYYYEYSPPVAQFISEHPMLRDFVRGVLEVPASLLKTVDQYY